MLKDKYVHSFLTFRLNIINHIKTMTVNSYHLWADVVTNNDNYVEVADGLLQYINEDNQLRCNKKDLKEIYTVY